MTHINQTFKQNKNIERTLECNPEDITKQSLSFFKSIGINRLSLGIQSFNQKELSFLGRTHSPKQLHHALQLIKEGPIKNINLDLIYGLPLSTLEELTYSLEQALKYNPSHLSTYSLSIENGTPFEKQKIMPLQGDLEASHYQYIIQTLESKNYQHYEISAFAKEKRQCLHNLSYWRFEPYIGLGPSAHSFIFPYRFSNPSNIETYLKKPTPRWQQKPLNPSTKKELTLEFFCSTLRLKEGIDLNTYKHIFNTTIPTFQQKQINKLIEQKLLRTQNEHIYCTKKGRMLLNEILLTLTQ